MVSGLVTSPCDQLRIFSGEARLMRMASKSAIGFAISKGLERNKVILHFLRRFAAAGGSCNSGQWVATTSNWPDSARAKLPVLFLQNPSAKFRYFKINVPLETVLATSPRAATRPRLPKET